MAKWAAFGPDDLFQDRAGGFSFHRAGGPEPVEKGAFQGYQVGDPDNFLVFDMIHRSKPLPDPFIHFRRGKNPAGTGGYLKNPREKLPVFPAQLRHKPRQGRNSPFLRQKNLPSSLPVSGTVVRITCTRFCAFAGRAYVCDAV
jgi:hypothetical protein